MNVRAQETGQPPGTPETDRLRASQRMLLDLAIRLVETHGPIAEHNSKNAAFSPLELARVEKAHGTMVSFSSLQPDFPLPPAEFSGALCGNGYNVLFVKDFARIWYQRGLIGLSNTRQGTTAALRKILLDLPRPWTFTGTSAGGYAALYFGAHLGADQVRVFSPQTLVDRHTFVRFSRARPFEMGFDPGDPENDLAQVFKTCRSLPRTRIYYGKPHHKDRTQAHHLQGFKEVTLHEVDAKTHNIAAVLKKQGALQSALF